MIAGIFQTLLVLLTESISTSKNLLVVVCLTIITNTHILLAVAGPNYECFYADVGANGRSSHGRIWRNSSIAKLLDDTDAPWWSAP